jgi:hypothetical protein
LGKARWALQNEIYWIAGFSLVTLISFVVQGAFGFKYARYVLRLSKNTNGNHRDPLFWDLSASAIDHAMDVLFGAPADMNEEQLAGLQGLFDWSAKQRKKSRGQK